MIEDTNKNEQLVKDKKEDGKATPTSTMSGTLETSSSKDENVTARKGKPRGSQKHALARTKRGVNAKSVFHCPG